MFIYLYGWIILIKKFAYKITFLIVITLVLLIALKSNENFRNTFYNYIYKSNISFASINGWYKSRFGSPLPFSDFFNDNETIPVFNEKLEYKEVNKYKDGVALNVEYQYLIPSLDSGIVIFVGEKEEYGKTVIVQQENGVDVWYSNINEINVKLYDYIKKGSLIGSVDEKLYLVFIKNGDIVNYEDYI